MTRTNKLPAGAILVLALFAMVATTVRLPAQSADSTDAGKAVFKRANCFGCHKWHGNGGGGYGGDALSLRKTELTREQIMETVECGRPGTGMPFFTRGAYDNVKCYGMNRQEVGAQIPPEANVFLRKADMEAVADYVLAHRWHVHQRRKGNAQEPHVNHLLEVASLIAEATSGNNPNLVIAALLHDAVEDQEVSFDCSRIRKTGRRYRHRSD
jgi:mono/diheme cytochrome c family protein